MNDFWIGISISRDRGWCLDKRKCKKVDFYCILFILIAKWFWDFAIKSSLFKRGLRWVYKRKKSQNHFHFSITWKWLSLSTRFLCLLVLSGLLNNLQATYRKKWDYFVDIKDGLNSIKSSIVVKTMHSMEKSKKRF